MRRDKKIVGLEFLKFDVLDKVLLQENSFKFAAAHCS